MTSLFTAIRENPQEYPPLNVRWSYGLAFFVLPCALVGLQERDLMLAAGGAGLGLAFCLYTSLFTYGLDHYETRLGARAALAGTLSFTLLLVLVLVGAVVVAVGAALGPVLLVGLVAVALFAATFVFLS